MKYKKEINKIVQAVKDGDSETLKALLRVGADVNAQDEDGSAALMMAAGAGYLDCVKVLLESGADVDARNEDGRTAYMQASDEVREEWQRWGLPY